MYQIFKLKVIAVTVSHQYNPKGLREPKSQRKTIIGHHVCKRSFGIIFHGEEEEEAALYFLCTFMYIVKSIILRLKTLLFILPFENSDGKHCCWVDPFTVKVENKKMGLASSAPPASLYVQTFQCSMHVQCYDLP